MRYVDGIFIIWDHGRAALDYFLTTFNDLYQNIKFTLEVLSNSSLPFLKVLLIRDNMDVSISVCRKPVKLNTDILFHA